MTEEEEKYQQELQEWKNAEPHDQCATYDQWLYSKPKREKEDN